MSRVQIDPFRRLAITMGLPLAMRIIFLICLLILGGNGCSIRYSDTAGHDTIIGFPPGLNAVETASGSNDRITWRRLRRTGIGLDVSKQSIGFMVGYEHVFLLWVEGDGAWEMSYSPETGMSIKELKLPSVNRFAPAFPETEKGVQAAPFQASPIPEQ